MVWTIWQRCPQNLADLCGALINGRAVVCTYNDAYPCYSYDNVANQWVAFPAPAQTKHYAAAAMTERGWWITGEANLISYLIINIY